MTVLGPILTSPLSLALALAAVAVATPLVEELAKSVPVWVQHDRLSKWSSGILGWAQFLVQASPSFEGIIVSSDASESLAFILVLQSRQQSDAHCGLEPRRMGHRRLSTHGQSRPRGGGLRGRDGWFTRSGTPRRGDRLRRNPDHVWSQATRSGRTGAFDGRGHDADCFDRSAARGTAWTEHEIPPPGLQAHLQADSPSGTAHSARAAEKASEVS